MNAHTKDWEAFVTQKDDGTAHMELAVDGITCAACIFEIERALTKEEGVKHARVNMSSQRLSVDWDQSTYEPSRLVKIMEMLGYKVYPFDPAQVKARGDRIGNELLRSLAVSGFAAMNIMLLSISVWSGNTSDIDVETRDFFHWISFLIALPTVVYAGRPFFRSAIIAIKSRRLNMDVPISIGVLLATGLSVVQTFQSAKHAYFDSAVMLLFFLLAGRYLDHMMRRKTRAFAENIATLKAESAAKLLPDGSTKDVPLSKLEPGDKVLVRAGERVSVDGVVLEGTSEIDQSLVTGETQLQPVEAGDAVFAGTMNANGTLTLGVTASAKGTLLDEVNRLLETALEGRSSYVQIADRASQLYAPVVHLAALATFLGWTFAVGADWQYALVISISVLIITCPCALGLAIPVVQVVASGLFFRARVLLNSGDAIERLAAVKTIVFDKTGTLTLPEPALGDAGGMSAEDLALAGRLALSSKHPLSKALAKATGELKPIPGASEETGKGVRAVFEGQELLLGAPAYCRIPQDMVEAKRRENPGSSLIAFRKGEETFALLAIGQYLRSDAVETVTRLQAMGYTLEMLSGDRVDAVADIASQLGIDTWQAEVKPQDKIARIEALKAEGHNVLMVGDGLNDAPALAAANVSMSPVSAVHVSQAAADAVFLGEDLRPVANALDIARKSHRLMQENLGLSVIYNMIAVPIAVLGYVTPLVAALAMAGSSVIVTLNAVRLQFMSKSEKED
ncbi:cation-translocating P-type ATPase [Pseudovibrio exalbescens]|uniref:cation-translocating P-type ATPase n=1 Tax=Pseudovibrio exalbescens TaxID=197461 RepID=UPI0023655896|nr:cation-translocating P-type ATPase [Pseudovibrio exalbescens]MDD7911095.1 cation-translocating P-type ATPase [Pseudovibrio exalbescens]